MQIETNMLQYTIRFRAMLFVDERIFEVISPQRKVFEFVVISDLQLGLKCKMTVFETVLFAPGY